MLNTIIDDLNTVPEALREHYEQRPDGRFALQTDDLRELRSSLATEKSRRQVAEFQLADLRGKPRPKPEDQMNAREKFFADAEKRLAQLRHGSPEYQAELAKLETDMDPIIDADLAAKRTEIVNRIEHLNQSIRKETIKQEAIRLSGQLARPGSSGALMPHVMARLDVEERDDAFVVFVKDSAGHRSTMSVDDLKEEFRNTPAFAPVVQGAGASEVEAHKRKVSAVLGEMPR